MRREFEHGLREVTDEAEKIDCICLCERTRPWIAPPQRRPFARSPRCDFNQNGSFACGLAYGLAWFDGRMHFYEIMRFYEILAR
jgi:hypothetical protein